MIYWTYAKPMGDGALGHRGGARPAVGGPPQVTEVEDIFVQEPPAATRDAFRLARRCSTATGSAVRHHRRASAPESG